MATKKAGAKKGAGRKTTVSRALHDRVSDELAVRTKELEEARRQLAAAETKAADFERDFGTAQKRIVEMEQDLRQAHARVDEVMTRALKAERTSLALTEAIVALSEQKEREQHSELFFSGLRTRRPEAVLNAAALHAQANLFK